MQPGETALLCEAGLLVPDGHENVAVVPGDDDDVPVSLFWSDRLGGLAAFSATCGPLRVPPEQLVRRRVDVAAVLASMMGGLELPSCWQPIERVDGLAWELGEVRLNNGPQRNSLWFARRLSDRVVQKQVKAALLARPHPRLRVLLTSSRGERLDDLELPGTSVVPMRDVLTTPDAPAVSGEILGARISGAPPRDDGRPIALSPDGRTLTINGNEVLTFTAPGHVAAIRSLVAAFEEGRGLPVGEITHLGSPDRLFGAKRWKELSRFLKSQGGLWRLVP
ncbi:hypothetical protein [Roseomonas populi]|uniref:Uncharacterized protein n=1 Tax=Roseomonas populi TaxID=3121582 RepID=A0ABT1XB15_9PROT|nr:hypothetical protein [Roseomonas pecuniae]MCR0985280.1 hypothetical protein [Roseomonas pecuniae]